MDMALCDDEVRSRTNHAPVKIMASKHAALTLMNRAKGEMSLRLERHAAAWDDDGLASMITA
jgi:hypothetical protein